ncbi:MAG: ferrous iron transport protein A [Gammaproteobacteria bacterium]|nr:ferrous iron transport protein A [Gammaproteobacteria bacterium]
MVLGELDSGQQVRVINYLNDKIATRMLSLGLLPTTIVEVIRKSPFADALYIKYGNTNAAVRKDEAAQIIVQITE